jgi:hypothetical protein
MSFIIDALAALGRETGVTYSSVVYALVSASHVLGISLLIGPIVLVDLALIGWVARPDPATLALLRRTAMTGLALAVATGVLLISARPHEYVSKPVVWAKLTLVLLAVANAIVAEHRAAVSGGAAAARLHAAASIALWLGVLLLGRWIAFA